MALQFEDVLEHLATSGYNPVFGTRPLKRLIQHQVVNLLSNAILKGEIKPGQTVSLKLENKTIVF